MKNFFFALKRSTTSSGDPDGWTLENVESIFEEKKILVERKVRVSAYLHL